MIRRTVGSGLTVLFALVAVGGCAGGREKGKNQDYDRPKAADTKR